MRRDLVEDARAGDREAFDQLARGMVDRMFGLATLILRDRDKAADATQEALISAWRDLPGLRDVDRFDQWLHRLLVRACYRESRRAGRVLRAHVRELAAGPAADLDPLPSLVLRDQLDRAFRRLGPEERTVLVLHHVAGFPVHDIAALLGLPAGTVKSRLHRGRQTMRAGMDADARVIPFIHRRSA